MESSSLFLALAVSTFLFLRRRTRARPPEPIVYLNGEFLPASEARVHVDDRAFLFADGVYEVTKVQGTFIFTAAEHFARLRRGLSELRIFAGGAVEALPGVVRELYARNGFTGQSYVYIQISRGAAAPRAHAWHGTAPCPTVYASLKPYAFDFKDFSAGKSAIVEADARWSRCDIKTTSLLPNVLANQRAKEAGAYEALLTRDVGGEACVVEASHSNVFAVLRGAGGEWELVTPPLENILPGVTRGVTLARGGGDAMLLARAGVARMREGHVPLAALRDGRARELMVTASTSFVVPITRVEGVGDVGDGRVGPAALALRGAWMGWWEEDKAAWERSRQR
jgi:D-alanine transaminase